MGTQKDSTTINDLQARAEHLAATCDGGLTFESELKALARDMKALTGTSNDGPALALSLLCEANDLLNALHTVDTEGGQQMGSAAWTLTAEVSRRVDSAIAHLDGSVPEPEIHDAKMEEPLETDDAPQAPALLLFEYAAHLENLEAVARMAAASTECDDNDVPSSEHALYVIARDCKRLGELVGLVAGRLGRGGAA